MVRPDERDEILKTPTREELYADNSLDSIDREDYVYTPPMLDFAALAPADETCDVEPDIDLALIGNGQMCVPDSDEVKAASNEVNEQILSGHREMDNVEHVQAIHREIPKVNEAGPSQQQPLPVQEPLPARLVELIGSVSDWFKAHVGGERDQWAIWLTNGGFKMSKQTLLRLLQRRTVAENFYYTHESRIKKLEEISRWITQCGVVEAPSRAVEELRDFWCGWTFSGRVSPAITFLCVYDLQGVVMLIDLVICPERAAQRGLVHLIEADQHDEEEFMAYPSQIIQPEICLVRSRSARES
ncbi:unnamed protein product, partial [Mesorhabditis spiculigera]